MLPKNKNKKLNSVKGFFYLYRDDQMIFPLIFINTVFLS